ncbi:MAG TPA: arginine--tRNA ligase [Thermoanaerobaculia bacterium]|jgi:arginyl-tRNA synthetase|nr:arginine--tRNA ligase [Thermoanaerobaculia bacterium]
MWTELKTHLAGEIARAIRESFGVEHAPVLEVPPRRELGDLASPAAMQLARTLKRNPKAIAEELAAAIRRPELVLDVKVLGAGYLNFFLDRRAFTAAALDAQWLGTGVRPGKIVIEHTNINPNKAAHIGHLRNAVLGDVLARSLKSLGYPVEVQNYIDDTGVQLADVVVGFIDLRGLSIADVEAIPEPFDFYCWDLYSEVGRWFAEDKTRETLRRQTLHEMESGSGPRADLGRLVARRVVRRHLATMRRLDVTYDLLTRESEILAQRFFEKAFRLLKESGAVHLEAAGKNAGCWVMPLAQSEEFAGLEDPDKVITRSDGTVTYVGKDIAYQLWKFGLLGQDFHYRFWTEEVVWETLHNDSGTAGDHPVFGRAHRVINVIDARQSYLQKIVRAGLQALGHKDEAERSVHFAYEMVSLSPGTARLMGYLGDEDGDDGSGKSLEMSGRKGIGVKADDLMDRLEAKSRQEVQQRWPDLSGIDLERMAHEIATAALRFFMVKATTNRVIAFDFDEALNFEGESGPYLQYSMVRVKNIRRRLREEGLDDSVTAEEIAALPDLSPNIIPDDLWDLVLEVAQTEETVEKGAESLELSLIARHALGLAQRLNTLYAKHNILKEADPQLRAVRLATVLIFFRGLETVSELLGIPVPEKM